MELKEVVNLRKLREHYESTSSDELCATCPFRDVCLTHDSKISCILVKMLGVDVSSKDMYEMEEDGEIDDDFTFRFYECDY